MSAHGSGQQTSGIALEASAQELRLRCEAIACLQGGSTYFQEELGIFRDYATEKGLFLHSPPPELSRTPDDEGNEHQVWFDPKSQSYLKATWPDFFGMQVIHRHDEDANASPISYLERWNLHNELFGDHVEFLGVLETDGQIRLLIRQPAIAGVPATLNQIRDFFTQNGWLSFTSGGEIAFFDPSKNVAVSDTHRGNIILMEDGLLAPIDLRIQLLSGSLLETVKKLCQIAHP
jgi:hypothetical protein